VNNIGGTKFQCTVITKGARGSRRRDRRWEMDYGFEGAGF